METTHSIHGANVQMVMLYKECLQLFTTMRHKPWAISMIVVVHSRLVAQMEPLRQWRVLHDIATVISLGHLQRSTKMVLFHLFAAPMELHNSRQNAGSEQCHTIFGWEAILKGKSWRHVRKCLSQKQTERLKAISKRTTGSYSVTTQEKRLLEYALRLE
ncbi:hypothetical protein BUALT_Bualt15G0086400 [Buddleja alternifolia]|uniref:Uncharacterized protein n=1 Tax=Buddleja alternifolia TaxID=168488 RepID=A0AAV6WDM6_9LAMI|nr:hypothetical protein BUALT_Bualt15G0086400 [Buddleja alternifolia]